MLKSYKQYIKEARRNPQLNPKIKTLDVLMKYLNENKDYYVSFRNINKLGINPISVYPNTPNGIYCYRLQTYKNSIENINPKSYKDRHGNIKYDIEDIFPFTGEELEMKDKDKLLGADLNVVDNQKGGNFVYIFKVINTSGYGIIRLGNMTKDHVIDFLEDTFNRFNYIRTYFLEDATNIKILESRINKLRRVLKLEYSLNDLTDVINHIISDVKDIIKKDNIYTSKLDDLEYDIKIQKKTGYDLIKFMEVLKRDLQGQMPNYSDNHEYSKYVYEKFENNFGKKSVYGDLADQIIDKQNKISGSKISGAIPGAIFWKILKEIFPRGAEDKWGLFMYKMGVVGVDDNLGQSIIHSNEPYQTVFFDKSKLEVVDVILNRK